MYKYVCIDKQSKKTRRAYYAAQRGSWNGVRPVSRAVPDRRKWSPAERRAWNETLRCP